MLWRSLWWPHRVASENRARITPVLFDFYQQLGHNASYGVVGSGARHSGIVGHGDRQTANFNPDDISMHMPFSLFLVLVSLMSLSENNASEELQIGDDAPQFSLKGSDGETYGLAEFKDKKYVVVAWFPKAFTGG